MTIKKLRYLLFGICAFALCTACEEEKTPGQYELAPELVAYEASLSGTTATIRVDNLQQYGGKYGLYLSGTPDMTGAEILDLSSGNLSGVSMRYDNSMKQWVIDINNLEDDATYYYCVFADKGASHLRSEVKSFTITRIGINSLKDLIAFRDAVNKGGDYTVFVKKEVVNLYVDIDLSSVGDWEPINMNEFTFNGNGHTIKNMTINASEAGGNYGFIAVNRATIANLNIGEGCHIRNDANNANVRCGGICGYSDTNSSISNCTNLATVNGHYAGGIAGYINGQVRLEGNTNRGAIADTDCSGGIVGMADGNRNKLVNNLNTGTISGVSSGGIVGRLSAPSFLSTVEGNTNNGAVDGSWCAGGISGYIYKAHLKDNTNNGAVSGPMKTTGGIAGQVLESEVEGNSNAGTVNGEAGSEENAWGKPGIYSLDDLVAFRDERNAGGEASIYKNTQGVITLYTDIDMSSIENWIPIKYINGGETFNGNEHTITNMKVDTEMAYAGFISENSGTIEYLNIGEGCLVSGEASYSGGVCGACYNGASVKNCKNAAKVTGIYAGGIAGVTNTNVVLTGNTNNGDVDGKTASAGIAAYVKYGASITIQKNINNATVSSGGTAGGIVGTLSGGTLKENTNNGSVTVTDGYVYNYGGGIAGYVLSGSILEDNVNKGPVNGYILPDYVSGTGITTRELPHDGEAGGIAGRVDASTLRRNANSGAVTGKSGLIGGVAGTIYSNSVLDGNTNTGTVNGEAPTTANEVGTSYQ